MASRHYGEFEILDYSESKSSFAFSFGAITALSLPGFLTNFGVLRTALKNIIVGTVSRERWIGDETVLSNVPPSDPNATRELKWLVDYETNGGDYHPWSVTIACPDTSLLGANSDWADYSDPSIAAFITAFESLVKSPLDPVSTVTVTRMQIVGRNL